MNEIETKHADTPATQRMLKMLLPIMFPMAMSVFPFLAAVTEVTSSGSDVPNAIIVRPMILSETPQYFAMFVADLTTRSLP